jgi:membrane protease YdiL (CAAX protease family)
MLYLLRKDYNTRSAKIRLIGNCVLVVFLMMFLSKLLAYFTHVYLYNNAMPFGARAAKLTDYFEIELAILLAIVILPFTEELAFRGWFSKNRWVLTAGLTMLVCIVLQLVFSIGIDVIYKKNNLMLLSAYLIPFFLICLYYAKGLIAIVEKQKKALIVFSILAFTAVHAINFDLSQLNLYSFPALVVVLFPHLLAGVVYTFVRLKAGLGWCYLLHAINNSFILVPLSLGLVEL